MRIDILAKGCHYALFSFGIDIIVDHWRIVEESGICFETKRTNSSAKENIIVKYVFPHNLFSKSPRSKIGYAYLYISPQNESPDSSWEMCMCRDSVEQVVMSVPSVLSFHLTGRLSLSAINWHVDMTLHCFSPFFSPHFVRGPCQHSVPLRGKPVKYVDLLQSFSKNWSTEV